jgi:subtilase family serine protease
MKLLIDLICRAPHSWLVSKSFTNRTARGMVINASVLFLISTSVHAQAATEIEISPMVAKSSLISPVDVTKEISVVLALSLRDGQGAADFVQHVSTPQDPLYRKYLTPEEFASRYGVNPDDYAALEKWATVNGLKVAHESTAGTILTVRGTVDQFQKIFKTQLGNYRDPNGKEFYSATISPTIPDEIGAKVVGVIGLTNSIQSAPLAKVYRSFGESPATPTERADAIGSGPGGAYSAADLRLLYDIPTFGGATPQTVALFEQGGFSQSDVDKYLNKMGLPHPTVSFVGVDGYNGTVDSAPIELEAVLDIDTVIGINPHVQKVLVYEDGVDPYPVALLDSLAQVADDNQAQTLSISYGIDEVQAGQSQITAESNILTQLAAEGIAVFASAGDDGAYGQTGLINIPGTLNVADPGSQPLVTCVGGTTLYSVAHDQYRGEVVWNELFDIQGSILGATGGGVSSYWAIPSYQLPSYVVGVELAGNGGSTTMRDVPDIAAVGDPKTGAAIYSSLNGGWLQVGGTSLSTPIWASYFSILNSGSEYVLGSRIGPFNPLLYSSIQWGFLDLSGNPTFHLQPVVDGTNGNVAIAEIPGYTAGFGYNNCAGSGTPVGQIDAYLALTAESGSKPPSGFVFDPAKLTRTTAKVHWTPASGATGYVVTLRHEKYPIDTFIRSTLPVTMVTKETEIEFTGLVADGFDYQCNVYAVNPGGCTLESAYWIQPR